jgi:hypothetical protein
MYMRISVEFGSRYAGSIALRFRRIVARQERQQQAERRFLDDKRVGLRAAGGFLRLHARGDVGRAGAVDRDVDAVLLAERLGDRVRRPGGRRGVEADAALLLRRLDDLRVARGARRAGADEGTGYQCRAHLQHRSPGGACLGFHDCLLSLSVFD